jgi:hypothetical protein
LVSSQRVTVGDTVLIHMEDNTTRPMIVSGVGLLHKGGKGVTSLRLSGAIFCLPGDRLTTLDGRDDPAQVYGQTSLHQVVLYGSMLKEGSGPGQWATRPTNLPAGR